ncbi:MAG TPA: hypothetical protein VIQ51_12490 [Chryseosolibacter sp.]
MLKQKPSRYFVLCTFIILYIIIGYDVERHETIPLFACYFLLFLFYLTIIQKKDFAKAEWKFWIGASLLFRAVLLFSIPALSDDFYRFIWDARVLAAGHNPFSEVPSYYMSPSNILPNLDAELFEKLNSKERFSSYPPVCQLIYWISNALSPNSISGAVVAMKSILFVFEIGTLGLLKKLSDSFKLSPSSILIYALNPLVILEITGNLHFEGVMIFFLLLAIHYLIKPKPVLSSAAFAFSVCTKLIPLLLLPLLPKFLGWNKSFKYWMMVGLMILILFLPLLNSEIIHGFSTSLGYYFQHFEFNASLYYLIREAGNLVFGFNIIQFAGPFLALAATGVILIISFRKFPSNITGEIDISVFNGMLWCLSVYLLSTTILHPWYIITLLAISVFTKYRFPIIWTCLIFLTYAGYTEYGFKENLVLVSLEYILLLVYLIYETVWTSRKSHS